MQAVNKKQLFLASRIALIVTAITFAYRAALEGTWEKEFNLTKEQLGWIFSPAFWGFTLAMIFGGPLCDIIGMKKLERYVIGFLLGFVLLVIVYNFATKSNDRVKTQYEKDMDAAVEKWKAPVSKADSLTAAKMRGTESITSEAKKKNQVITNENTPLDVSDKISKWKKASYDQRITLCVNIVLVLNRELSGEKLTAIDMHNCIEEATRGLDVADELTIIYVASNCASLIKKL